MSKVTIFDSSTGEFLEVDETFARFVLKNNPQRYKDKNAIQIEKKIAEYERLKDVLRDDLKTGSNTFAEKAKPEPTPEPKPVTIEETEKEPEPEKTAPKPKPKRRGRPKTTKTQTKPDKE